MQTFATAVIALSFLVAGSASALTIDNFEEGPFSLSALSGEPGFPATVEDTQAGLSTLNVISGRRNVFVFNNDSMTATTADLALTAGDNVAVFTGPAENHVAVFHLTYAFASPFDLTQGGSLDRFLVDFVAPSGSGTLTGSFHVSIGNSDFTAFPIFFAPSFGQVTVPFSSFVGLPPSSGLPPDLTQVDTLLMIGEFHGSVRISNIAAIPEPSTALLLGCGLLAVAAGRRRARKPRASD